MNTQNSSSFEDKLRRWRQTSPWKSGAFAGTYLVRILAPWAALVASVALGHEEAALLLLPVSLLNTAVTQRAFENLVHDAAHYNWNRKSAADPAKAELNDLLATVLAAAPVMQDVKSYRPPHELHHKAIGSHQDPCRSRQVMQLHAPDRDITRLEIMRFASKHLVELNLEALQWKNRRARNTFLAWHLLVMIAPAAFFIGIGPALFFWILYWQIPMTAILPLIRAVAERWEHNYAEAEAAGHGDDADKAGSSGSQNDAKDRRHGIKTFSNLTLIDRFIFHPAGDAYHAAHHAYPYVPAYRMWKLHKLLMKYKAAYAENPVRLD